MDTSAPPAPPRPVAPQPPPPAQAHPLHLALAQTLAQPGGLVFASQLFPGAGASAAPGLPQAHAPAPAVTAVPATAVMPGTVVPGPIGAPQMNADGTAYLPGLTKSGKRRRKHPVAEVKGQWTQEEDERLIRRAVAVIWQGCTFLARLAACHELVSAALRSTLVL